MTSLLPYMPHVQGISSQGQGEGAYVAASRTYQCSQCAHCIDGKEVDIGAAGKDRCTRMEYAHHVWIQQEPECEQVTTRLARRQEECPKIWTSIGKAIDWHIVMIEVIRQKG